MIRSVLQMGNPLLWQKSLPVEQVDGSEMLDLYQDLWDTMEAESGAGLAAPQIGVLLQVVVFGGWERLSRYPEAEPVPRTVLINPHITFLTDVCDQDWEGCLSVRGLRGLVSRPNKIRYQGLAPNGDPIDRVVDGFHARVVQHECDHLWGILYPMKLVDMQHFGFVGEIDNNSK